MVSSLTGTGSTFARSEGSRIAAMPLHTASASCVRSPRHNTESFTWKGGISIASPVRKSHQRNAERLFERLAPCAPEISRIARKAQRLHLDERKTSKADDGQFLRHELENHQHVRRVTPRASIQPEPDRHRLRRQSGATWN